MVSLVPKATFFGLRIIFLMRYFKREFHQANLFEKFSNFFDFFRKIWLGGAAPQTSRFLAGGAKLPQTLHWTTHPTL